MNANVKIVSRAFLHQKWISLRETKAKMISDIYIHISSNTFHQRKCFVFVILVCNYLRGPRVAAATWPWTYLLNSRDRPVDCLLRLVKLCSIVYTQIYCYCPYGS